MDNEAYKYLDELRPDVLRMIPHDGRVIGSVGCGYATTEAILVEQGREVHGVDVASAAIAVAATRLTTARLIRPDDLSPFPLESLDGLILADVIEHIPFGWRALRSYAGSVKPGGWVVISVPNMRNVQVLRQFILHGDWPEDRWGIFDATHLQVMSEKRLVRWCGSADLKPERWYPKYDPISKNIRRASRIVNGVTLGLCHSWFMFQLQVRCRKVKEASNK